MYNLKLLPYKMGSESGKDLAELLEVLRVRPDGEYIPRIGQTIINWGSSGTPLWSAKAQARNVKMLNKPAAVGVASNKLSTLQALSRAGVPVPIFTTSFSIAQDWVRAGATVVERHELSGNSGDGIRIVSSVAGEDYIETELEYAPLYTKFIPKSAEFRVHVFNGQVIDYIQKKKVAQERRTTTFNAHVSSVNLGWVFTRTGVMDSPEVRATAIKAVAALGLDFGAVDIVYCEGRPFVLEINTAPGLTGTTLIKYTNAFRRYMGVGDLSTEITNRVLAKAGEGIATAVAPAVPAAVRPSLQVNGEEVILKLDRATAYKLRDLLNAI